MSHSCNNTNASVDTTTRDDNQQYYAGAELIKELLKMVRGEVDLPPLGREFSYIYSTNDKHFVTQFDANNDGQWEGMIDEGLTWSQFRVFVKRQGCVQIGSLYVSEHQLDRTTFRKVFHLGDTYSYLSFSIIRNQVTPMFVELKDVVALRGLAKLFTISATVNQACYIACDREGNLESISGLWPFTFDWGVTLGTIDMAHSNPTNISTFATWMARNFRRVKWSGNIPRGGHFFHLCMLEAGSVVEHLELYNLQFDQVEDLSAVLRQTGNIKSLEIAWLQCDRSQKMELVQTICECTSLSMISIEYGYSICVDEAMEGLLPLIRCGHLKHITFRQHSCYFDGDLTRDHIQSLRLDRTQIVIKAIEGNVNLLYVDTHTKLATGPGRMKYIDCDHITSQLDARRDKSIVSLMVCHLASDCPLKLALFGRMICRLGACRNKSKMQRSAGMLFNLLRETSSYVRN